MCWRGSSAGSRWRSPPEGVPSPDWFRPPVGELDEVADLVAAGRAVPATISAPFGVPDGPLDDGPEAGELLSALRDEERW